VIQFIVALTCHWRIIPRPNRVVVGKAADMLRFQLTDIAEDRATMLAQSLRRKFIENGVDPDELAFVGMSKNNMGISNILELITQINLVGTAETGLHVAVIAHCLYDLLRREVVTVVVEGPKKKIEIKPSAMSMEELQGTIHQVAQDDDGSK
jgi:hypothetical protein